MADASHELRSPVAAIRTELEVAQRTATAADWPAIADRLLAEEARLEAVITDLLLLASLDEGAPLPDAVAVDLAGEAREEARAPPRTATTWSSRWTHRPPRSCRGSRMQLRRAMANLLDNAGRHARTTVRLSVHERDGRVRVLVDDDGPGIPEADHERVFERFVRLDEHRARAGAGGAGLGLSLVRRIVERHHGTASIDVAPLGGARIVLDLPAGWLPADDAVGCSGQVAEVDAVVGRPGTATRPARAPPAPRPRAARRPSTRWSPPGGPGRRRACTRSSRPSRPRGTQVGLQRRRR